MQIKFLFAQKINQTDKKILSSSKNFKNTFRVALQYHFIVVILLSIVFNLKLGFKLKIDPKCAFKSLEKNLAILFIY